jgi:TonB-dependent starch-binding outer membrane protein SusC
MLMRFFLLTFQLLILSFAVAGQNQALSGKVFNEAGESIAGATVAASESQQTLSGTDGSFILTVDASVKRITVSAKGYITQQVRLSGTVQNIVLEKSIEQLNEVIVVGYGQAAKRDVSGSISKIRGKEIENQPIQSFESALQGKAAGVVIENSSGKVGQGIKVRIRGTASISANTQPLYVLDGVPLTTASQSDLGNEPTNPLTDLNPNDIESVEILKDAAAAAIYGARAANGVVLITTKRGVSNNRSTVELNAGYGVSNPTRKRGFLNAREYVQALRDAARNDGRYDFQNGISGYATEEAAINDYISYVETNVLDYYSLGTDWRTAEVDVNWEDKLFRKNAMNLQYDLSVRGGNDRTRFFASGYYNDQEAIVINNGFRRYGGRLNLEHSLSSSAAAGMNVSVTRSQLERITNDAAFSTPGQLVAQIPVSPLIDPQTNDLNANTLYSNGLFDAKYNSDNQITFRTIGNLYAQFNILPQLFFRSEFGADILNLTQKSFADRRTQDGQGIGNGQFLSSQNTSFNTNNYMSYSPSLGNTGRLTAVLGMSYLQNDVIASSIDGENYPSAAVKNLSGATDITFGNSSESRYNFLSYFLRTNLTFRDKFLLGLSIRADGSSRFGPANRFGYFPAISGGWILSEEALIKGSNTINYLKLRVSAGVTGNAEIGEQQFRQLFSVSNYPALPGFIPQQLGDPNLKWEKTFQYDAGIEFGFFSNRLSGEVDVYAKKTNDLLLAVNVPATNGHFNNEQSTNQILQNLGSLENKGLELSLNVKLLEKKRYSWVAGFNIGFNRNRVTDIDGQVIQDLFNTRAIENESIGVFYLPRFVGVDPTTGDALYEAEDGRPTSEYNIAPRQATGNSNPRYSGGFTNSVTIGDIDASIFFYFVEGREIYNDGGRFMSAGFAGGFDNQTKEILNAWKNPGDITAVPRSGFSFRTGHRASSRWVYDGSFLRLRQLSVGYTFRNIRYVQSARIYLLGTNLWTKTEYAGDPEVNTLGTNRTSVSNITGGVDFYTIPQPKNIAFGLNVKF